MLRRNEGEKGIHETVAAVNDKHRCTANNQHTKNNDFPLASVVQLQNDMNYESNVK